MFYFIIAFLAGDLLLQQFTSLPSRLMISVMVLISCLLCICLRKYCRYIYFIPAFLIGFAWCGWYAHHVLSWQLPVELEGKKLLVTGSIASLPISEHHQTKIFFAITKLQSGRQTINEKANARLIWREPPYPLQVGDEWQLMVKLKRIHGTQNPGGFDFEAWSLQKGLQSTGYVVNDQRNRLLSHHVFQYPIDQFRQRLQTRIEQHLPHSSSAPWLMALMIGERTGMLNSDWQVLRKTGTNHLMAIGGLHIGIMSGFAYLLACWLWKRSAYLPLYFPSQLAGTCAAMAIGTTYSAIAGFSIPTQRACIMLIAFSIAHLSRKKLNAWHAWSFALLIVILMNPLLVLSESFWLSFGTIALIIYGMDGRLAPSGYWWKWGRVQWVIGVGLIPLTLYFFHECSLVSFIANSIAIPWLGFFVLPLCFLSDLLLFVWPSAAEFILFLADRSLSGMWMMLTWFSQIHFSTWQQVIPTTSLLVLTILGVILLLLPIGTPARWIGILWVLPLLCYSPAKPDHGAFWMTLLDVGQGLSVVVQTKRHVLVFDAGPKFHAGTDTGETIVVPYLQTLATRHIDMLVISHGDNDHIGGANALLQAYEVKTIRTSVPEKLPVNIASDCLAGMSWKWDGVTFSFLHPDRYHLNDGNDSSCVLKIENAYYSVLLPGDIEKYAEQWLTQSQSKRLKSTVIVAPHHGSKTSDDRHFLELVQPEYVLYATGYRNRYHFPHQRVQHAYEQLGTIQFDTATLGAIECRFANDGKWIAPRLYRSINQRYWYN